jgi:hypothetical protein
MAALWGFFIIAFAVLSQVVGVTVSPLHLEGLIYRKQDPSSFRKAVGVHVVLGLLFIIGWFVNLKWHVFE